jgi:hypothetical protein
MGGVSKGHFEINTEGHAVFHGEVSLDNNGGFSSVRYRLYPKKVITGLNKAMIRLKGDGKAYQFRLKSSKYDRHSYIHHFKSTGDWEVIEIPLRDMYPGFRGRKLDMPNYPGQEIEELTFLIANKQAEHFRLEIDNIRLQ